jgi:heme-degrading monooxygenase HmoA
MRTIHVQHADGLGILTGMITPAASPSPAPPVVRSWSARATPAGADAYVAHFRSAVLPELQRLRGHRGAMVLRRSQDGLIRITVLTLWTSMAAVAEFAGADTDAAVVESAARDVLADFDARVEHFELALHAEP